MFIKTLFKLIYVKKENLNEVYLLKKFELQEILLRSKKKNLIICINTTYKWKMNKVQSVNLEQIINKKLNELINWWKVLWA